MLIAFVNEHLNNMSSLNLTSFPSPGNISLPGGFKMANSSNDYCDVATATGKNFASKLFYKTTRFVKIHL